MSELKHFGIPGQKWGIRRWQNQDGSFNYAGKLRYGRLGGDGRRRSHKLSEKQRRFIKIGAAVIATGLVAYGAYKLSSGRIQRQVDLGTQILGDIQLPNSASDFISDKTKDFAATYGIPLKNNRGSVADDIAECLVNRPQNARNDCTVLGVTACLRRMGLDVHPELSSTNLSVGDLPNYFKGIRSATVDLQGLLGNGLNNNATLEQRRSYNARAYNALLSQIKSVCNDSDDACGIINFKSNTMSTGHLSTWFKEQGAVKLIDLQSTAKTGRLYDIFANQAVQFSDGFEFIEFIRLDNLTPNKFILGGNALNPDKIPIIQKYRIN